MSTHASTAALKLPSNTVVPRRISRFALQQRSRIEPHEHDDGVRRLMWAMLKDTLRCFHAYVDTRNVRQQRQFRDADRWVQSRDLRWVFSFENVCAVLNIDSDYLRNELRRWRRSTRAARPGQS